MSLQASKRYSLKDKIEIPTAKKFIGEVKRKESKKVKVEVKKKK